jgi:hypothetical protein
MVALEGGPSTKRGQGQYKAGARKPQPVKGDRLPLSLQNLNLMRGVVVVLHLSGYPFQPGC